MLRSLPVLHLLRLSHFPIYQQLEIEEALLRADDRNWCLINSGSSQKAIVMGISSKPELHVEEKIYRQVPVPLIRRFSGGGTVFVDSHTEFMTLICNAEEVHVPPFPQQVMQWTASLYQPFLAPYHFRVQENDFSLGDRKFGGNAQYLQKKRWLQHSSLLWDYDPQNMAYLKMPPKMPAYRQGRKHEDFICKLRDVLPSREELANHLIFQLHEHFEVKEASLSFLHEVRSKNYRKSLSIISID